MDNEKIQALALSHGFKFKQQLSGEMGLNAYVFDFAAAIRKQAFEDVLVMMALRATPQELIDYCEAEYGGKAPKPLDRRTQFEQAAYQHYLVRHAAGKTTDHVVPAGPIEELMWRTETGEYGVLMFNAAWWAWQKAQEAAMPGWISVDERLPADETPVIILHRGEARIGELRWDHPGFEDTYSSYRYWDNPHDDGQGWEWDDITLWMPLPASPGAPA